MTNASLQPAEQLEPRGSAVLHAALRRINMGDKPVQGGTRTEYVRRVNRVTDYIETHLAEDLSVAKLAKVANFSPFHFHRVFGAMMGETLNQFVRRLRLERSASRLLSDTSASILEVALDSGFSSAGTFARAFREAYGISASEWRQGTTRKMCAANSKIRSQVRKLSSDYTLRVCYSQGSNPSWRYQMNTELTPLEATIEVKELDAINVAYVRHVGPYAGDSELFQGLFGTLSKWAGSRGLLGEHSKFITVAHDNPHLTDEDKLRISVCVDVPEDTPTSGEIGSMVIPGGTFGVARFEVSTDRIGEAWDVVMGHWLPESGYQPDERACYEVCLNDPRQHPEGKAILDICVPVRPL